MILTDADVARFWAKVRKSDECWLWTRPPGNHGYGQMGAAGTVLLAHRISYTIHRGDIPDGLTIDHLCHEKLCVNPEHLEVVTAAENVRRAHRDGLYGADPDVCRNGHRPDTWRRTLAGARRCPDCQREHNRRYARKRALAAKESA